MIKKIVTAFNEILKENDIKPLIQRIGGEDPEYPLCILSDWSSPLENLKGGTDKYNTNFAINIIDQTKDYSRIEELADLFIKFLNNKEEILKQKITGNQVTLCQVQQVDYTFDLKSNEALATARLTFSLIWE